MAAESLREFCLAANAHRRAQHLERRLVAYARQGVRLQGEAGPLLSFAGNDYLGLAQDARVIQAAQTACTVYGTGAGASRLVDGNHPLYAPLEAALAAAKHCEAACVFGSGYLANIGIIPALVGRGDLVLADRLAHACLLDGARLSGAALKRFAHNDVGQLAALLQTQRAHYGHVLILVDHVYSMDGDLAPLAAISALAQAHDAWLLADDAHGLGVVTPDPAANVDLWMGTLSKSLGSYGGYVAASRPVIDHLVNTARSLIFTTGLPPASLAAAQTALEIAQAEPWRGARAVAHAQQVAAALPPRYAPEGVPASAILPVVIGDAAEALSVSAALRQHGMLAPAIRPPTVPPSTARLRLSFSALHDEREIDRLIDRLRSCLQSS